MKNLHKKFLLTASILILGLTLTKSQESTELRDKFVIVLDIQKHFTEKNLTDSTAQQVIRAINLVVERANSEKVLYVKSILSTLNVSFKGFSVDTLPDLEFDERLKLVNENIVQKNKANAFKMEEIAAIVANCGTTEIVVIGLMAEHCVKETVLGGKKLGYNIFVIPEAIAGKTNESKKDVLEELAKEGASFLSVESIIN